MSIPSKNRLVEELVNPRHRTLDAAAKAAGVHPRTARRWRREPDFMAALDAAQAVELDQLTTRLLGELPHCEALYLSVMADSSASQGVRLRAAGQLVDLALRLHESRVVERRLAVIEAKLGITA